MKILGMLCLCLTIWATSQTVIRAADHQTVIIPGGGRALVRVFYTNEAQGNQILKSFKPYLLETDYQKGFHLMRVSQQEVDQISAKGIRVELSDEQEVLEQAKEPDTDDQTIPGYPCYRTVEGTFATAEAIAANNPHLAEWIDVGDSWEKTKSSESGYDMRVLVLTNKAIQNEKPALFVTAAIHAREYATAELVTRFAEQMISGYGSDPDITWILDHHQIHLMLQTNPDGRKIAEDHTFWRKNTNAAYCIEDPDRRGADLNRNFTFNWNCCDGSSEDGCSEVYHGTEAASEPEIDVVEYYLRNLFHDRRSDDMVTAAPDDTSGIYLDIHSYGRLVLWPWGAWFDSAPNNTQLQTLGRKFAFFNRYSPEQAIGLYPTDGTSDDHAYGELGIASYCFEIGTTFFQTCNTFEKFIYPENLPALLYAAKVVRTPYMTAAGPDALEPQLSQNAVTAGTPLQIQAVIDDTRYRRIPGNVEQEPVQQIIAAEYYIDTPPWQNGSPVTMLAHDGIFDSSQEIVTANIDTTLLAVGRHLVFVRGQDGDYNWGAFSAVFLDITE